MVIWIMLNLLLLKKMLSKDKQNQADSYWSKWEVFSHWFNENWIKAYIIVATGWQSKIINTKLLLSLSWQSAHTHTTVHLQNGC